MVVCAKAARKQAAVSVTHPDTSGHPAGLLSLLWTGQGSLGNKCNISALTECKDSHSWQLLDF